MNGRLTHFDVAKGILILLVLFAHIPYCAGKYCPSATCSGWLLAKFAWFYGSFFKPAFFLISGYVSNHNKSFSQMCQSLLKGLVLPWLLFSFIFKIVGVLFFDENFVITLASGERRFFLFDSYWFLTALLIAKLIYWTLKKLIKRDYIIGAFSVVLVILSFALNFYYSSTPAPSIYGNWFHYRSALAMVFFLWVGDMMKVHKVSVKFEAIIGILFVAVSVPLFFVSRMGVDISSICPIEYAYFARQTKWIEIPFFLFYGLTGSLLIITISRLLKDIRLLAFFGRHSLVIYCVHFFFLIRATRFVAQYFVPETRSSAVLFFVLVAIIVLTISSAIAVLYSKIVK